MVIEISRAIDMQFRSSAHYMAPSLLTISQRPEQHLRIKKFSGDTENAEKSQVRIAVSVYVLVVAVKKQLNLDAFLYTLLRILSVTLFEKMPLQQAFSGGNYTYKQDGDCNRMNLFTFSPYSNELN